MNRKICYLLVWSLFLTAGNLMAAPKEKVPAKQEARLEESAERDERTGWFERIFGFGKEREEKQTSQQDDEKEADKNTAKPAKAAAKQARGFSTQERAILEDWQRGEAGWKKSGKRLPPG